jgi:hypothetical protein
MLTAEGRGSIARSNSALCLYGMTEEQVEALLARPNLGHNRPPGEELDNTSRAGNAHTAHLLWPTARQPSRSQEDCALPAGRTMSLREPGHDPLRPTKRCVEVPVTDPSVCGVGRLFSGTLRIRELAV